LGTIESSPKEAVASRKLSPLKPNSLVQSSSPLWQELHSSFGLSEYEAKVYVSLIDCGASRVGRLSTLCGVPRSKIYKTLQKLVERNLVTEIPEEPKLYAPISPHDAFKSFFESLKQKQRQF
jgi:sugar-specific transcriptional regulator TrmB